MSNLSSHSGLGVRVAIGCSEQTNKYGNTLNITVNYAGVQDTRGVWEHQFAWARALAGPFCFVLSHLGWIHMFVLSFLSYMLIMLHLYLPYYNTLSWGEVSLRGEKPNNLVRYAIRSYWFKERGRAEHCLNGNLNYRVF